MRNALSTMALWMALHAGMAQAGQHVGNGGDAHVCRDLNTKAIVSAELYDFFEIRHRAEGIFIDMGSASLNVDAKVQLVLARLARLDSARAERLLARYQEAFQNPQQSEYIMVPRALADVPDTGGRGVVFDEGCGVEQVAVRQTEVVGAPYEKRFQISEPIFSKFDNNSKAGLILHELIYEDAIYRGFKNSNSVRFFVAFVSSAIMNAYQPEAFRSLVETNLFFGDLQVLLDRSDETWVVEYLEVPSSFADAVEFCESNRFGGQLLTGYNGDFRVRDYFHSPLIKRIANERWWGEMEMSPTGQLSAYSFFRDRNRFFRSEMVASTKLSFMCAFLPPLTDGHLRFHW